MTKEQLKQKVCEVIEQNAEKIIGKQKTELTLYVLLNTVLAISLAQILAKSFLEPLSEL